MTVFNQFWVEFIRYMNIIPIVRSIAVANQNFYFISSKVAVMNAIFKLLVTEMVFIFSFGYIFLFNKLVTYGGDGFFDDLVHFSGLRNEVSRIILLLLIWQDCGVCLHRTPLQHQYNKQ